MKRVQREGSQLRFALRMLLLICLVLPMVACAAPAKSATAVATAPARTAPNCEMQGEERAFCQCIVEATNGRFGLTDVYQLAQSVDNGAVSPAEERQLRDAANRCADRSAASTDWAVSTFAGACAESNLTPRWSTEHGAFCACVIREVIDDPHAGFADLLCREGTPALRRRAQTHTRSCKTEADFTRGFIDGCFKQSSAELCACMAADLMKNHREVTIALVQQSQAPTGPGAPTEMQRLVQAAAQTCLAQSEHARAEIRSRFIAGCTKVSPQILDTCECTYAALEQHYSAIGLLQRFFRKGQGEADAAFFEQTARIAGTCGANSEASWQLAEDSFVKACMGPAKPKSYCLCLFGHLAQFFGKADLLRRFVLAEKQGVSAEFTQQLGVGAQQCTSGR